VPKLMSENELLVKANQKLKAKRTILAVA